MISELDALQLPYADPASNSVISTGTVMAVDTVARTVQVAIRQDTSAVATLPAVAGKYRAGGLCRVLHNADDSARATMVLGPVDPLDARVLGTLSALNSTTYRATVTVLGVSVTIPYMPTGTYTVGARVWVGLNDWGTPEVVLAPSSEPEATAPPTAPGTGGGSSTVHVTTVIGPQWSGTYRAGNWDRWNTGRYGGRSTLYQGSGFGSGPLVGLAVYGDQLVNLGATSIDAVQVMTRPVGLSGASGPAVLIGAVQGSAAPAGGPTGTGPTFAENQATHEAEIPAETREAMRTGAVKGLATVGSNYWAIAGAGNGDGMVLRVTYTRPA